MATETNTTTEELEETDQINENGQDATTESGDSTVYTKDKQMLDQERANTRKARAELASVTELYETSNERIGELESQLEELKQKNEAEKAQLEARQKAEQDKLDDMDPDLVDPKVIANIKAIEKRLERQNQEFQNERSDLLGRIDTLSKKATQLENERAEMKRKTEHEKTVESVLTRVEASLKRHGVDTPGQYRTEAMKVANELVDTGERKKPENMLEGIELMEECFLRVIEQHKKKKSVSAVDGGKSGVTTGARSKERKTGSLKEVAADMLKDKSWKED